VKCDTASAIREKRLWEGESARVGLGDEPVRLGVSGGVQLAAFEILISFSFP